MLPPICLRFELTKSVTETRHEYGAKPMACHMYTVGIHLQHSLELSDIDGQLVA